MFHRARLIFQLRNLLVPCQRLSNPLHANQRINAIVAISNRYRCAEVSSLPEKADVKMKIIFTCKVCNAKNEKYFSKVAYTSGVVIIRCDGCQNNHLIADNLNWFPDVNGKNIEDILKEKGVQVSRRADDTIEFNDS